MVIRTSVWLDQERDTVFGFFSDAFQLERITPGWLNFRILTPAPIRISQGTLIDYRIRLRGIPLRWRTVIAGWNPPEAFTDRQLRGPYSLWEHFHTFEAEAGGTRVTDRVCYRVPGGRLVNWLCVQSELRRIFEYRGLELLRLFSPTGPHGRQTPDSPRLGNASGPGAPGVVSSSFG